MSKKKTAFQNMFSEPWFFGYPWGYVLDGENYSADEAREVFFKEFSDNIIDDDHRFNLIRHHILTSMSVDTVTWHAGINEDGEPGNAWWIGEPVKNRSKRVFTLQPDMHLYRTGHSYHKTFDKWGHEVNYRQCANCGERA